MATLEDIQDLRPANLLQYDNIKNPSLMFNRTYKSFSSSNATNVAGDTITFMLGLGEEVVWPLGCSMKCSVNLGATDNASFGTLGTFPTVSIKEFRLTHASGEILEQYTNVSGLAMAKFAWENSAGEFSAYKGMMGYCTDAKTNTALDVHFPLSVISGFFSNSEQWLAPGVLSGAKVEIVLQALAEGVKGTANSLITVSNAKIICDTAQIFEGAKKLLMLEQASPEQGGLTLTYPRYQNYRITTTDAVPVSQDLQISAQLVEQVIVVPRTTADLVVAGDKSIFQGACLTNVQLRNGDVFLPQQATSSNAEMYSMTCNSFKKGLSQFGQATSRGKEPACTFAQYILDASQPVVAFSLSQNPVVNYTGLTSNGARYNNISFTPAGALTVDIYVKYLCRANFIGKSCVLDR